MKALDVSAASTATASIIPYNTLCNNYMAMVIRTKRFVIEILNNVSPHSSPPEAHYDTQSTHLHSIH